MLFQDMSLLSVFIARPPPRTNRTAIERRKGNGVPVNYIELRKQINRLRRVSNGIVVLFAGEGG